MLVSSRLKFLFNKIRWNVVIRFIWVLYGTKWHQISCIEKKNYSKQLFLCDFLGEGKEKAYSKYYCHLFQVGIFGLWMSLQDLENQYRFFLVIRNEGTSKFLFNFSLSLIALNQMLLLPLQACTSSVCVCDVLWKSTGQANLKSMIWRLSDAMSHTSLT